MTTFFGSGQGQPIATQATRANGIQVQSSEYGKALPLVYGRSRLSGELIWYGDFQAVEHQQQVGKGGGNVSTSYTYSSSFALAICEGPIQKLGTIWNGSGTVALGDINGTLMTGAAGQAPWSHWTGADALNYPYVAYIGCLNLLLGSSPSTPNLNFEVYGLLPFNAGSGLYDAEPSAIVNDVFTSPTHGANFTELGDLTQYRDYCTALGLFISPVIDTETTLSDALDKLLTITNSTVLWSGGALKFLPYGDQPITGNGVTYTPATAVAAVLGPDQFIKAVQIERKPLSDLNNVVRIEFLDASQNYVTSVCQVQDQADIDARGVRSEQTIQAHAVTSGPLAMQIAQQILQRNLYIRNSYTFTIPLTFIGLEPGDIVSLTDPLLGLNQEPVRITEIKEGSDLSLDITAEEFPAGVAAGAQYPTEVSAGFIPNIHGAPDTTQTPVFFRAPQFLAERAEVWMGVAGAGPNWGGAYVWASYDNSHYTRIGTVYPGCRYGELSVALATGADPDTVNSFGVDLYGPGQLNGGTQQDADQLVTMLLVDQELISYESTVLNGNGTYTLGNGYLRRGAYNTVIGAHAISAPWLRIDDHIFRWPFDPGNAGMTVHIKFQAFNLYGGGTQDLATVTPYTYVLGAAEEIPDTPPVPANFTATGVADGVKVAWTTLNPAAVDMTSVERSSNGGVTWGVIAQVKGDFYPDHFTDGSSYQYRARARSKDFLWSAYTAVVTATGKTVANGADVTRIAAPTVTGKFLVDFSGPTSDWNLRTGNMYAPTQGNGVTGGYVAHAAGYSWFAWAYNIPYDPSRLYRLRCRARRTATSDATTQKFYLGVEGVGADGVTLINTLGSNGAGSQHYIGANNVDASAWPLNTWQEFTGWFRGNSAAAGGQANDPNAPATLYTGVTYFRPLAIMNYIAGPVGNVMELDYIAVDIFDGATLDGVVNGLQFGSVGLPYIDPGHRPIKLHRPVGGIDVSGDDFSQHSEVLSHIGGLGVPTVSLDTQVREVSTYARPLASVLSGGKVISLHRPVGGIDLSPDVLPQQSEVTQHLGGANVPTIDYGSKVTGRLASLTTYTGGQTVDSLKPAEAAANITETRTSNDTSNVNGLASANIKAQAAKVGTVNHVVDPTFTDVAKFWYNVGSASAGVFTLPAMIASQGFGPGAYNQDGAGNTFLTPVNPGDIVVMQISCNTAATGSVVTSFIALFTNAAGADLGVYPYVIAGAAGTTTVGAPTKAPANAVAMRIYFQGNCPGVAGNNASVYRPVVRINNETVVDAGGSILGDGSNIPATTQAGQNYMLSGCGLTVSGSTSGTISMAAGTVYPALVGGGGISLGASSATGLTPSTKYYCYLDLPSWTGGTYQLQVSTDGTQISRAPMRVFIGTITTNNSGGTGGGGPIGGCLHSSVEVLTRVGMMHADELCVGDELLTPAGVWTPILTIARELCGEWLDVETECGTARVTTTQPYRLATGRWTRAKFLNLGEALARGLTVLSVTPAKGDAEKVIITIAAPHAFLLTEDGPELHNGTSKP